MRSDRVILIGQGEGLYRTQHDQAVGYDRNHDVALYVRIADSGKRYWCQYCEYGGYATERKQ